MEDDDWDDGHSVEDIISTVMKTKRNFCKVKLALPPRPNQKPKNLKEEDSPEHSVPQVKTEELKSSLLQGAWGSSSCVKQDKASVSSNRLPIYHEDRSGLATHGVHDGSLPTSKFKHSRSASEISSKSFPKRIPYLETERSISSARGPFSSSFRSISNAIDKENTNPGAALADKISRRNYTSLNNVDKELLCKASEVNRNEDQLQSLKSSQHGNAGENERELEPGFSSQLYSISKTIKKPINNEDVLKEDETNINSQCNKQENVLPPMQTCLAENKNKVPVWLQEGANACPSVKIHNLVTTRECLSSETSVTTTQQEVISSTSSMSSTSASITVSPTDSAMLVPCIGSLETSLKTEGSSCVTIDGARHKSPDCGTIKNISPEDLQHTGSSSVHLKRTGLSSILHHSTTQTSLRHKNLSKSSRNTEPLKGQLSMTAVGAKLKTGSERIAQTCKNIQQDVSSNRSVSGSVKGILQNREHSKASTQQIHTHTTELEANPKTTSPVSEMLRQIDHIFVNGKQYLKLELIGRGGSSKVYEVLDLQTRKVKAIKVVELEGVDDATLKSYRNEIDILLRLRKSDRIIQLYDYEESNNHLSLVMEKGNDDLATVIASARGKKAAPISSYTIQHYWEGMLRAVQAIHQEGIIHSDLKPANFLLFNGMVKLIDFGIASSIQQDMTSIVKDSQAGTFSYMSPESLLDVQSGPIINGRCGDHPTIKIGVKSDVWSLGCILYNLVYGRTPFQHLVSPFQKLAAISNPNHKISFPDIEDKQVLDVLKQCLQFYPGNRPSIQELLQHPYLTAGAQNKDSSPTTDLVKDKMISQLAQLTPNRLNKISSIMQQLSSDEKRG
ncbi:uncharacterized protein Mps1 [Procambarus clarkii]|uniref:uncharacterized protein Mps1 n=1 Tax=Procambarus clarkii TaxID=6728 RepID=UPI003743F6C4